MKYNQLRKILTVLVIVSGLLSSFNLVMGIGGGGVLNDLYFALEEINDLEKKGLLDNPPGNISDIAKREIELVHNSSGLKQYIQETEASLSNTTTYFFVFTTVFFLSLILRIFFRKKRRNEEQASSS